MYRAPPQFGQWVLVEVGKNTWRLQLVQPWSTMTSTPAAFFNFLSQFQKPFGTLSSPTYLAKSWIKFKQVLCVHLVRACNLRRSLRNSSWLIAEYNRSSGSLHWRGGTWTGLLGGRRVALTGMLHWDGSWSLCGSNFSLPLHTTKQVLTASKLFANFDPWLFAFRTWLTQVLLRAPALHVALWHTASKQTLTPFKTKNRRTTETSPPGWSRCALAILLKFQKTRGIC